MAVRHGLVDVAPLRSSPVFRRLWIGRAFSGFGSQMTLVAVMFQVWQMTGSTVWTGAVGLAQAIPIIVFGLFAGSVIDRVDRRRFYLITTTGQAVCSILLTVQGFFGNLPVIAVLLLVAVQSCFVAGGGPASRTFIPRLLRKNQLASGLALDQIAFQGAMLLGPALGGLVLGWLGVGGCYLMDAITFALAFYGAFGLPPMRPDGEPSRPGVRGVLDGLAFLVRNPVVRGALLTDLAAMVLSMPISLFPLVNAERFGNNPRTLGLLLTAVAVGGVFASVFSGVFTRLARPGLVMLGGSAVWGVALALFGISTDRWAGLAFLALAGAADTVSVVSRGTIVQLHTPDAFRPGGGRRTDRRPGRPGRGKHAWRPDRRCDVGNGGAGERWPAVRDGSGAGWRDHTRAAPILHDPVPRGSTPNWLTPAAINGLVITCQGVHGVLDGQSAGRGTRCRGRGAFDGTMAA